MGKFNVGDIVFVRQWKTIEMMQRSNKNGILKIDIDIFAEEMRKYCEKRFEIDSVISNNTYTLCNIETKEVLKNAEGMKYFFPEATLFLAERHEAEMNVNSFLKVKFTLIGRGLTAEVLKAPSVAIKECFKSERHYSLAFKHEVDFVDGPGDMKEFVLRIPYADCGRHDVMTFVYSSKEEAKDAMSNYMRIIAEINRILNIKARVFVAK